MRSIIIPFSDALTIILESVDQQISKTGNLTIDELGMPKLPLRTYKELALFSKDVYGDNTWENFFTQMGEIQTSTSLSKDAILLKLSVTQKKELADTTPQRKVNKGWFRKNDSSSGEEKQ